MIYGLTQLVKSLSELFLVHQLLQKGILLIVGLTALDDRALILGVDLRIGLILLTHLVELLVVLGSHLLDLTLVLLPELFDRFVHHFQLEVDLLLICNFWLRLSPFRGWRTGLMLLFDRALDSLELVLLVRLRGHSLVSRRYLIFPAKILDRGLRWVLRPKTFVLPFLSLQMVKFLRHIGRAQRRGIGGEPVCHLLTLANTWILPAEILFLLLQGRLLFHEPLSVLQGVDVAASRTWHVQVLRVVLLRVVRDALLLKINHDVLEVV